ncbi:zinc finger CCCH domain-containing protein 37 isoform X1 [Morus notabilis]|uniref:zinc finger CCCH domain-containing protein 37 isoform X1 n=1 Tax=Morus notabilis TaxID=981085 RepID=UPI000CED49E7|nr:zinc finger CCCH domain-containing protein 37 isoform X1 [Morus notabilis]
MAGHLYGFGAAQSAAASGLSSIYAAAANSRALTEPYFPASLASSDPSNYPAAAAMFLSHTDPYASHLTSLASWHSAADDNSAAGIKRSSEALYHPTVLGAPNTIGQSEAWYSTTALAKRFKYEGASNLPIYPQRPGEKDCAHYMLTRTCKFGDSCKFDHPIWVPEGGIPDWKEIPPIASEALPERLGQPDCPYFLKTQRCKFGLRCKFNHPKDKLAAEGASENGDVTGLPERPSEAPCAFYLKTGTCKFGSTCKFHHPKDIQLPSAGHDNGSSQHESAKKEGTAGDSNVLKSCVSFIPAIYYNTKELPIRPGEPDCPFYLKTGSCKYGATCRYNHPDRLASSIGHAIVASPAAGLNIVNSVASLYQTIDPRLAQATVGVGPNVYPQRPGQLECDYYMKTGECKFGERCKFHHPMDRLASTQLAGQAQQQIVKLTLAGLPRREGSIICPYYLKTGACKFGATCKFDHPPPGEVMAKTTSQGIAEGEAGRDEENGGRSIQ